MPKQLLLFWSFAINLQEEDDGGEIAFHFNPRPEDGVVVRNSFDGNWQSEERDQPDFPFGSGVYFRLRIEVAEEGFRTYVNGRPFINYGHRLDMGKIKYLRLTEGAEFYDITLQDKYVRKTQRQLSFYWK